MFETRFKKQLKTESNNGLIYLLCKRFQDAWEYGKSVTEKLPQEEVFCVTILSS